MSMQKTLHVIDTLQAAPRTAGDLVVICDITIKTARAYVKQLRAIERLAFDGFGPANGTGPLPTRWRWVEKVDRVDLLAPKIAETTGA
jgi:hypothetical protein